MLQTTPVIYLAGPYSQRGDTSVATHIERARIVASALRRMGCAVVVPHLESLGCEDALDEPGWIRHGLLLLAACDTLVLLPGWQNSRGTAIEQQRAEQLGIPVWHARRLGDAGKWGIFEGRGEERW